MARFCLWQQDVSYPARVDRKFGTVIAGGVARVVGSGIVVNPSSPVSLTVSITAGTLLIPGSDQLNQGVYLCDQETDETLTLPAAPPAGKRIDVIYARVQDLQAGGPAGNTWSWFVAQGAAATTPVPPAVPSSTLTSAVAVARVLRTAGDSTVTAAMITDVAPRSGMNLFGIVSGSQPSGPIPPIGTIWVQV